MKLRLILASLAFLCLNLQATAQEAPKLDLTDPAVKAELDEYMKTWLHENAGLVLKEVQANVDAQRADNMPKLSEFVSQATDLVADAPHDGADLASAKVIVIEFFDFNCPYCQAVHGEIKKVKTAANADVAFVYRDLPILMDSSKLAAFAGRAAMNQGKYPELADAMFTLPAHGITEEGIVAKAKALGLDMARFDADRKDPAVEASVKKSFDQAQKLKIAGTPFLFFWNPESKRGAIYGGALPAAELQAAIDAMKAGQEPQFQPPSE
jgi:protein-disulfide isomerase